MLIIFAMAVIVATLGYTSIYKATKLEYNQPGKDTLIVFGAISLFISAITFLIILLNSWDYIGAAYKTKIINNEYKTNYTQDEVFWADDVIEVIREVQRNRYEINGNLMKQSTSDEE